MPSTTIHFPDHVLAELDQTAVRRGISRNKFVIEACKAAVARDQGAWPEDFFNLGLSDEDQQLLSEGAAEMDNAIYSHRRNSGAAAL
jgi:hypothetical protein